MTALRDAIDATTLGWVKPELDETLRQARIEIEGFAEDPADTSRMRFCASYLHQVQGTLRMVELYAPAMVAEEMELLAQALLGDGTPDRDTACATLMRGVVLLPDYLERLQSGHKDIPIVLLPLLNELRAARGESGLSESALFAPDLGRPMPAGIRDAGADVTVDRALALPAVERLTAAVAAWSDESGPEEFARAGDMADALRVLLPMSLQDELRRMLWVAGGVADAVRDDALKSSPSLREAFASVQRAVRTLLVDDGFGTPRAETALEPTRQLLYHVDLGDRAHPALTELRHTFDLDAQQPTEAEISHAQGSLSGRNRALLDTVSAALKEDLLRVKDMLDLHLRAENADPASLQPQVEALGRVADTLGMLGLGVARKVVQQQRDAVQAIVRGERAADESALLDVAGALLYVDATLDDQVARLGTSDASSGADEQVSSESRRLIESVAREAIANFADARQAFVAFVETSWDHAQLAEVPRLLEEVSGALTMLEFQQASAYIAGIRLYIDNELIGRKRVPNGRQLDTFADALASLEYYLEALRENRFNREDILDIARNSLESLGYWPLPEEASKPRSSTVATFTTPDIGDASTSAQPDMAGVERAVAALIDRSKTDASPAAADRPSADASPEIAASLAETAPEQKQPLGVGEAPGGFEITGDEIDDEIREIFLEEFGEEIDNLDTLLPVWREDPTDAERLRTLRRVFHTLKGSGRLVGARALGEFSWKIENMLNRVLDGTRPASPAVVAMVDHAFFTLPQLLAALRGTGAVTADLNAIQTMADRVAGGEEVFLAGAPSTRDAPAAEESLVADSALDPPAETLAASSDTQVGALPHDALPAEVDALLLEILDAEVAGHLVTMHGWLDEARGESATLVSDGLLRATHTMNGAFAMAEVPALNAALGPAETYIRRLFAMQQPPSDAGVTALGELSELVRASMLTLHATTPYVLPAAALASTLSALRDSIPADGSSAASRTGDAGGDIAASAQAAGKLDTGATPFGELGYGAGNNPMPSAPEPLDDLLDSDDDAADDSATTQGVATAAADAVNHDTSPTTDDENVLLEELGRLATLRSDQSRSDGMHLDQVRIDEQSRRDAERVEAERVEAERVEAERVEAERVEAERVEAERVEAERVEAERVEAERVEAERVEGERVEGERVEAERVEAERVEAERVEAERVEAERVEAERVEAERVEAERVEAERVEAERVEAERVAQEEELEYARLEAEYAEADRVAREQAVTEQQSLVQALDSERAEAERVDAERVEAERVETERVEAEHVEAERVEADRVEAARIEAERVEAERVEAERVEAERVEAERVEAERVEAERVEAEHIEAERIEAERVEAERVEAERIEAERIEAERVGAQRAESERVEAERVEAEHIEAERIEAERVEAERVEAERVEAERVEAERVEAERIEAERIEAERVGAQRAESERVEAERVEAEHIEAERIEAERVEAERVEAERVEAERVDADRIEAERIEAERVEAEDAEAERAEAERAEAEPEASPQAVDPAVAALLASIDTDPDEALDLTGLDPDLVDIFVEEAGDLLDHSDGVLGKLRDAPAEREPLIGLQRDLHTIKGGARMAGIMAIGELGHAMETLLEAVVESRSELGRDGIPLLEQGFDRLHAMVTRVAARRAIAMPDALIEAFNERASGRRRPGVDSEALPSRVPAPKLRSAADLKPLSAPMEDAPAVDDDDIAVRAPQEQVRIRADLLDRLVTYAGEVAIYRSRLEQQLGAFRVAMGEMGQTNIRLRDQLRRLDIETEAQIIARYQRESDHNDTTFDPLELDRFSTLQQLSRALGESAADMSSLQGTLDDLTRQYETLLLQQSRVSSDLQQGLMRTRMVPFDALVPRLRRVVRQASGDTGKQVQLKLDGAQGELDRNVLERMTAPLEHMLRNAVAHGLETPQQRRKAKKPDEGVVRIAVRREGSEVVLEVGDDGRGLDRAAIRRRGEERGLVSPEAVLADGDLDALIFEPGFSTADEVSRIAGRGVGMDVVASEVRQLGGTLDIVSRKGQGTTFTLRLPQTLAVTQAVFVRVGDTSFAVPIASVRGAGRLTRADIGKAGASFAYGGEDYPVHDLGGLVGHAAAKAEGQMQMPLLLIRSGDLRAAVAIDEIVGNREIVVKPVGPQVASIPGIFGATVMGDGSVVVILDVAPLVRRQIAQPRLVEVAAPVVERRTPLVMVVDDSVTMRKVTGRILERHNLEVSSARDGIDALEHMVDRVPDLMLLDIEMPRMDGYELATAMKADPRLRDVPIVMITSRTGEKHRQRAFEIGVERYMGKPYQENELLRNVYELLKLEQQDDG